MAAGEHVAKPLLDAIGDEHFQQVAAWLRDVASQHALEVEDQTPARVISPSVAWLAEAVTFYAP